MTLSELIASLGGMLVGVLTIVQITPLKINPWSIIVETIGKAMHKDLVDKLESVQDDVQNLQKKHDELRKRMDKDDTDQCRTRILRFSDELRRGVGHSEEFFNQILDDISDYERYCIEHPEYRNNKAGNAIAEIDKVYQKCMEKNSFL